MTPLKDFRIVLVLESALQFDYIYVKPLDFKRRNYGFMNTL